MEENTEVPVEIETTTSQEEGVTVNVTIQQPSAPQSGDETLVEGEEITAEIIPEPASFMLTSPVVLADPESGDVPSVMADVVVSVLGEYQRLSYVTEEYDADGNLLSDGKIGYPAILTGMGIICGNGGYLKPKTPITRAEAAVMIYNYMINEN